MTAGMTLHICECVSVGVWMWGHVSVCVCRVCVEGPVCLSVNTRLHVCLHVCVWRGLCTASVQSNLGLHSLATA